MDLLRRKLQDDLETERTTKMRTDIIILTKTPQLLDSCLASLEKHADPSCIGNVVVGITGGRFAYDCWDLVAHESKLDNKDKPLNMYAVEFTIPFNYSRMNNIAANDLCNSECVTFMNDDVVLVEDPFKRCLDVLEKDKRVGTVGIELIYPNGLL